MKPESNVSDLGHRLGARLAARALACVLALGSVFLSGAATGIMQTDGGPVATRVTSTVHLSSAETVAHRLQGRFRGFLGTPIHPNFFISAQHIGISPTDTIDFVEGPNVGSYPIVQWFDDPASDLRIVEIAGSFSEWALLNAATIEPGKQVILFGRGGTPNGSVLVDGALKGWTAAAPDGQIAWGRNVVSGTFGLDQIYARFDRNGIVGEAGISNGDSGGAWFYVDALGAPRLYAISFAVSGPFQQNVAGSPSGSVFEAALFDTGGLWIGQLGAETFIPENPVDVPGVAFGSRISTSIAWIESIVPISVEDSDSDGIPDSQDNCPFIANPNQSDNGGLGFGNTPDGIGDACQCGDVTGEGQANDTDAQFIKRQSLGLFAPLFFVPDNCDVNGDGRCTGIDGTLVRHAAAGNAPEPFGQHCANARP
ncbi:MAG: thrombospondin type 3 repeat-containing protein [Myxococcota bacterium]